MNQVVIPSKDQIKKVAKLIGITTDSIEKKLGIFMPTIVSIDDAFAVIDKYKDGTKAKNDALTILNDLCIIEMSNTDDPDKWVEIYNKTYPENSVRPSILDRLDQHYLPIIKNLRDEVRLKEIALGLPPESSIQLTVFRRLLFVTNESQFLWIIVFNTPKNDPIIEEALEKLLLVACRAEDMRHVFKFCQDNPEYKAIHDKAIVQLGNFYDCRIEISNDTKELLSIRSTLRVLKLPELNHLMGKVSLKLKIVYRKILDIKNTIRQVTALKDEITENEIGIDKEVRIKLNNLYLDDVKNHRGPEGFSNAYEACPNYLPAKKVIYREWGKACRKIAASTSKISGIEYAFHSSDPDDLGTIMFILTKWHDCITTVKEAAYFRSIVYDRFISNSWGLEKFLSFFTTSIEFKNYDSGDLDDETKKYFMQKWVSVFDEENLKADTKEKAVLLYLSGAPDQEREQVLLLKICSLV